MMTVFSDIADAIESSIARLALAQTQPLAVRVDDVETRLSAIPVGQALTDLIQEQIAASFEQLLVELQTPPATE